MVWFVKRWKHWAESLGRSFFRLTAAATCYQGRKDLGKGTNSLWSLLIRGICLWINWIARLRGRGASPTPDGWLHPDRGCWNLCRWETDANAISLPTWDAVLNTYKWITHCSSAAALLRAWDKTKTHTLHFLGLLHPLNHASVSWSGALTTVNEASSLHHQVSTESKESLLIDFYLCFWTSRELQTWHQM